MIYDLEEKFDVELPYNSTDNWPELQTVGDLNPYVRLSRIRLPPRVATAVSRRMRADALCQSRISKRGLL